MSDWMDKEPNDLMTGCAVVILGAVLGWAIVIGMILFFVNL
jgi:hypothetical protein